MGLLLLGRPESLWAYGARVIPTRAVVIYVLVPFFCGVETLQTLAAWIFLRRVHEFVVQTQRVLVPEALPANGASAREEVRRHVFADVMYSNELLVANAAGEFPFLNLVRLDVKTAGFDVDFVLIA